jgi:ABC-2 type transport system permease protein
MSTLYDSRDLKTLKALPIRPWQIMASKVLIAYFTELLGVLVIAGPFFVTLGTHLKSASYWVPAVLNLLLIPAIPVAISVLVISILMKFTAHSPKRDWFRVLSGVVVFAFIMVFNYLNVNMTQYGPERFVQLLMENNGLVSAVGRFYPVLRWRAWALTGGTLGQQILGFLLYTGVSVGALVLVIWFSQRWFFEGMTEGTVSVGKKERVSKEARKGELVWPSPKGTFGALFLKEHRLLVRNPTYLMTAFMNLMLLPLMFIFVYMGGGGEGFTALRAVVTPEILDIALLILVAVHAAITGMNQISSTAVSREGQTFWISKVMPVSPGIQVKAKLLYSVAFSCVQLVILVVSAVLLLELDVYRLLILSFLGLLVSVPVNAICLLYDLSFPKLEWTDPQQAMKGNFGTMVSWMFSLLYVGVMAAIVFGLIRLGIPYFLIYCISGALLALSAYGLVRWLDSVAAARYAEI